MTRQLVFFNFLEKRQLFVYILVMCHLPLKLPCLDITACSRSKTLPWCTYPTMRLGTPIRMNKDIIKYLITWIWVVIFTLGNFSKSSLFSEKLIMFNYLFSYSYDLTNTAQYNLTDPCYLTTPNKTQSLASIFPEDASRPQKEAYLSKPNTRY